VSARPDSEPGWDEIDFEHKRLSLHDDKGTRGGGSKATSKTRIQPLLPEAVLYLAKLPRSADSPFLFPSDDDPARPRTTGRRAWSRIRRAAGFGNDVVLHTLRHTFGTREAAKGRTPNMLAAMMRHANTSTTDRYTHSAGLNAIAGSQEIDTQIEQALASHATKGQTLSTSGTCQRI
jgi:integrase